VVGPKVVTIKCTQQDSTTFIVTPLRDCKLVFKVTGICNVQKVRRDIESNNAVCNGGAPDSDASTLSVVLAYVCA